MVHLGPVVIMGKEEHLALLVENKALSADIAALSYCMSHGIGAGRICEDGSGGYWVGYTVTGAAKYTGLTYAAALSEWLAGAAGNWGSGKVD